jgi:hypothetical protein
MFKFVPEVRKWFKTYTVWGLSAVAALEMLKAAIPTMFMSFELFGVSIGTVLTILLLVATGFLRFVQQFDRELEKIDTKEAS